MYYTSITDANGNEFKIAVNIAGHGAPTEEAVAGMFYLDLDSGYVYKCIGGSDWVLFEPTPSVTESDNGKFLRVVGGKWVAVALTDVSQEGG